MNTYQDLLLELLSREAELQKDKSLSDTQYRAASRQLKQWAETQFAQLNRSNANDH
jgi:hypothetical protein